MINSRAKDKGTLVVASIPKKLNCALPIDKLDEKVDLLSDRFIFLFSW